MLQWIWFSCDQDLEALQNTRHPQLGGLTYFGHIVESAQVLEGAGEVQAVEGLPQGAVSVALWGQSVRVPRRARSDSHFTMALIFTSFEFL